MSAVATDLLTRFAEVPADRLALVAGGRESTFGALRADVARAAAALTARGIGPESVVAVSLPRGTDLVVALLAALTAGAAYLPVDPAIPAARRRYLVEDAGADLVVDTGAGESVHPGVPRAGVADLLAEGPGDAPFAPVAVRPGTLAYVIYTSGSTGLPKGVEVSRGSVAGLLADLESAGLVAGTDRRVGWNASASFDASVQQWTRICRGDALVLLDDATRADPALMARLIKDAALTDLDLTPSHADPLMPYLEEVLPGRPEPLTVLIGGEAIGPSLWRRIGELADEGVLRMANVYGPTECTVDATSAWVTADSEPTIGAVLPGLSLYLLDEKLNQVADGEAGEIYLGGSRVGRGYRGRPALTASRFIADVVAADGSRMYRTGDLARRGPGGALVYLGRADGQVKVHGHRIELGEIEAALCGHPDVAEAAVLYRDDCPSGPGLVGYYRAPGGCEAQSVRAHVAEALPSYMVPAVLVPVESFPRTVNGKLDRAALPAPGSAAEAEGGTAHGRVEALIAEVWSHVLGIPGIGPDDNFFKLGGHSLLSIKLVARVRTELGVALPVKAVYRNPRLRDLATHIESLLDAR